MRVILQGMQTIIKVGYAILQYSSTQTITFYLLFKYCIAFYVIVSDPGRMV